MGLDRINLRIMELLQKDARTPVSELARILDRAESTVRDRVLALEQRGFIVGYRAALDPAKLGYGVRAILRADIDMRNAKDIAQKLYAIPNVVRAHVSTGPKPLRVELVARDFSELEQVLQRRVAPLHLAELEVGLVVQSLVEQRSVPLRMEEAVEAPAPVPQPAAEEPADPLFAR